MATLLQRLAAVPRKYPFTFGAAFSCAKTSAADLMVQKFVERREEIDVPRNAAFAAFGLFYLGGVQYALYVPVFGRMFPRAAEFAAKPLREKLADPRGMANVGAQVFIDQCVHHPFMYFPAFYAVRELARGGSLVEAREKYLSNLGEDVLALWKVWVPATFANFAFSPMYMRIPVVAMTSLVWTSILSIMRGASEETFDTHDTGGDPIALLRTLEKKPLNPAMEHIIISATGPDRVGVVAELTAVVKARGGNIYESRMLRLGADFTVMLLVEVEPGVCALKLKDAVAQRLQGFTVYTKTTATPDNAAPAPLARHLFRLVGPDAPGLLAEVAQYFSRQGMSISQLRCDSRHLQEKGAEVGDPKAPLFVLEGTLTSQHTVSERELLQGVASLSRKLGVKLEVKEVPTRGSHMLHSFDEEELFERPGLKGLSDMAR